MDKETIRAKLVEIRRHLEAKGIIKPKKKSPEEVLKNIEQRSFEKEEFKETELGF